MPHFGLRDEGLLVCYSQPQCHVEACCFPRTHHFGANCSKPQEVDMGMYPYLNHSQSRVVITGDGISHQHYGVLPIIVLKKRQELQFTILRSMTVTHYSHWMCRNVIRILADLLLICHNQDAAYLVFYPQPGQLN